MPSIRFDFSHHNITGWTPETTVVKLPPSVCIANNFVLAVTASDLIVGRSYRVSYQLLNPSSNPGNPVNIFNPPNEDLYASFTTQKFATITDLEVQGNYVLQATLEDMLTHDRTSYSIALQCGEPALPTPTPTITPTVTPSRFFRQSNVVLKIVDPDLDPIADDIITIPPTVTEFPLVAIANNAIPGAKYEYEFFDSPPNSIVFENKKGSFYAGLSTQNFNSKITFNRPSGMFCFVYATIKDLAVDITKYSQPVLFKKITTNECSIVLPSGLNLQINAPHYRSCNLRGLTNGSITSIGGGSGFTIGDKLTPLGGGGTGAEIQVISGGITIDSFSSLSGGTGYNIGDYLEVTGGGGTGGIIQIVSGGITYESITSLTGSTGFKVGDLLTTVGGGGSGAVIRVTSVDPVTGAITGFEVINSGSGYTFAPSGLVALTGDGIVSNVVFNADNFSIPAAGGITANSITVDGGTGYNIGEILNIVGGGGEGAQIQIISGSLTRDSINSLSGGSGYVVGDLLTTTGGGGEGVVIRVKCVNGSGAIANCPDGSVGWEIVNAGYGFTGAPTGLVRLTGNGSNATLSANADNFSITKAGQITEDSIIGLINTGTGHSVGDILVVSGGGGSGATIIITSVSGTGAILSYVILNGGSGYTSAPTLLNENSIPIVPQPSWNVSNFTDPGFIVINQGSGYINAPTLLVSENGNGSGAIAKYDTDKFTDPSFIVINSGSGYTSAPTGLSNITGDGTGATVVFNANNFTIPLAGGITPESISLEGGTGYNIGEVLNILGGGGTGAQVKIISGSLTEESINSITGGTGFAVGDILTTTGGGGQGVVIRVKCVNGSGAIANCPDGSVGWEIVNAGYGFTGAPTGLVALTGNGTGATISANANNFSLTKTNTLTNSALDLSGGGGYNIGDRISISGGDTPAIAMVISGTLTSQSINSLLGGSGYAVGDLLTTAGGGGEGVVIRVKCVDGSGAIANCPDGSVGWEIVNGGYGFTGAPTSLVSLTGNGNGATISANTDNFSLTKSNGITNDSLDLFGGSGYNIGDKLTITGGTSSATIQIISGGITIQSINSLLGGSGYAIGDLLTTIGGNGEGAVIRVKCVNGSGAIANCPDGSPGWEIINAGYGFTDAPTGLIALTGTGSGAIISANSDNFNLTRSGGITKDSISGLIGSSNNPPFTVGSTLYVTGGGGSGATILITRVDDQGRILDYIILNSGYNYDGSSSFVLKSGSVNGNIINNQPTFDVTKFTKDSFVILDSGSGFQEENINISNITGNGFGINKTLDINKLTQDSFVLLDSGSGFVSSTISLSSISGNGSGSVGSLDTDKLTTSSFIIINAGSGYTSEPTSIVSANGNGNGVISSFVPENFSKLAVIITNPGSGYLEAPTGLEVKTGYGQIGNLNFLFNDNNFIEISGPPPTPSPTSTVTPTPSTSRPAPCNDLQSAGGQNDQYLVEVALPAPSGQGYLIVQDSPALMQHSVVVGVNIQYDTHITKIEPYKTTIDDSENRKKITLSRTIFGNISKSDLMTIYTVDNRVIKTSFWAGTMNFSFDAYNVPDRFKVFGIPIDNTKPEILLFDSGYRGTMLINYVTSLSDTPIFLNGTVISSSDGKGLVSINKSDGMIYIRVTVEAPGDGTAWKYLLECPIRDIGFVTQTPTKTSTLTPTPTPSNHS
jgi:hypothetical protein